MGMLAYFVHIFVSLNQLTPDLYLVMFIVSTLALAWALWTLFSYHRSSANSRAVGIVDLLFVGAFIGAVYAMRVMASADCTSVRAGDPVAVSLGPLGSASLNVGVDVNIAREFFWDHVDAFSMWFGSYYLHTAYFATDS